MRWVFLTAELLCVAAVIAGTALIFWPAALIVTGLAGVALLEANS